MLHWTPARSATSTVTPIGALLGPPSAPSPSARSPRSEHARMLAHAATRRHAARGADGDYWKACAPAAVAKAAAIRRAVNFSPLP